MNTIGTDNNASFQMSQSEVQNASLERKLMYKQFHLKNVANFYLKNKQKINTLISEMNSDGNAFFIEDVVTYANKKGISLNGLDKVSSSLVAFNNLDNESWLPTISFIQNNENSRGYTDGKPIVVLNDFNESEFSDAIPAYQENEQTGELEPLDSLISEDFAAGKEIIDFDIASRMQDNSNDLPGGPSGGGGGGGSYIQSLKITDMRVKQHKEDWHKGASELNFTGYKMNKNDMLSGECGELITGSPSGSCGAVPRGRDMFSFKRRWIRHGNTKNINYTLGYHTNYSNEQSYIYYVIFEYDSWPAPFTGHTFTFPNSTQRNLYYRSWQSPYDNQVLSTTPNDPSGRSYASSFSTENAGIYYKLDYVN